MKYRCVMCPYETENKWALRAHLKKHKGELVDFNVRIPRSMRDEFKRLCEAHEVTTCHVILGLMAAAVESFRRGVVFEWDGRTESVRMKEGSNPITVVFNQTFLGKPRSAWKIPLQDSCKLWPPSCSHADDFHKYAKEVGCLLRKDWVKLGECWSCFQRGGESTGTVVPKTT